MINLMLADDQSHVRLGLAMMLGLEADLQVIGEADSGASVLELAQRVRPDVIVIDVEMPERDGISATEALRALVRSPAVVILTIHDDAITRARALAAGAAAFVSRCEPAQSLATAIRQAAGLRQPQAWIDV